MYDLAGEGRVSAASRNILNGVALTFHVRFSTCIHRSRRQYQPLPLPPYLKKKNVL